MKRGDKVVCIDDTIKAEMLISISNMYRNWVKKGQIYTVREILNNNDIVTGILLKEVRNQLVYIDLIERQQEPAFGLFRFRVIDECEEEMSYEREFERQI